MAQQSFGEAVGELIKRKRIAQGLTQLQLAEDAYGDPSRVRRIVELETGQTRRPHPKTIDPLVSALGIAEAEIEACAISSGSQPDPDLDRAYREARNLIDAIAAQFEHSHPEATLAELDDFLRAKATEWRRLRTRIDEIELPTGKISNLRTSAINALANGLFDEVDMLLAEAEDLQQSERTLKEVRRQSEIRVLRGEASLLNNDAISATKHMLQAAEFFLPFDESKMVEILDALAGELYETGKTTFLPSYQVAAALLERTLISSSIQDDQAFIAKTHYRLSLIYRSSSELAEPAEAEALLDKALSHARLSVREDDSESGRFDLASARISLSNCLFQSGKQGQDPALIDEAISTLRGLIRDLTAAHEFPELLAHACNSLGGALLRKISLLDAKTPEESSILEEGLEAFRRAVAAAESGIGLDVWGAAQANLGRILARQAKRSADGAKAHFLRIQSAAAFMSAMEAHQFLSYVFHIAEIQKDLGDLFTEQAMGLRPDDAEVYLVRALNAYEAACRSFTVERNPEIWAQIQVGMARAVSFHSQLEGVETAVDDLEKALALLSGAQGCFEALNHAKEVAYCRDSAGLLRDALRKARTTRS